MQQSLALRIPLLGEIAVALTLCSELLQTRQLPFGEWPEDRDLVFAPKLWGFGQAYLDGILGSHQ